MKVEIRDLSPVKKTMSVEVPPEAVAQEAESVLRRYAERARIPGFRQGRAPLSLIRAKFAREVDEDLRERVVTRYYQEAAREQGLEPLGSPVLDEVAYVEGEPLRFRTTFEVRPSFTLRGHRGVEVRRRAAVLDPAEVDRLLEELRQSRTQLVADEGVAAAQGHVVLAEVEGTPEGGEVFRHERALIELGAEDGLPGLHAALVGVRAGETRELDIAHPPGSDGPLSGKTVHYRVAVRDVKRKETPALDDEFAKDVGDFEDLAALRRRVERDLLERRKREIERDVRQSVLDRVLLENPVVLPEVLVDEEVRHRLEDLVRGLILQGVDPQKLELDWERLRHQQEQPARKAVHARLVLDSVAREETLTVGAEELAERIRHEAEHAGRKPDQLRRDLEKHGGVEALRTQLVREKALDLLTSVANIQNEV